MCVEFYFPGFRCFFQVEDRKNAQSRLLAVRLPPQFAHLTCCFVTNKRVYQLFELFHVLNNVAEPRTCFHVTNCKFTKHFLQHLISIWRHGSFSHLQLVEGASSAAAARAFQVLTTGLKCGCVYDHHYTLH